MKASIITTALLCCAWSLNAQKYFTKTGITEFNVSVETFEPVGAVSESTTAILNTETGDVAALIFIKSFHFKVALMEEHFNENYMDSDEFPKATFNGVIEGFKLEELSDDVNELSINGVLTIKGESIPISTKGQLKRLGENIEVEAEFHVKPVDFGIEIPAVVRNKIAETVNITLNYELVKRS